MRATQRALRTIIERDFAGSQTEFSRTCAIDTADTSRVLNGVRPATVEIVGRALAALGDTSAAELLAAFLADIHSALHHYRANTLGPDQAAETPGRGRSGKLHLRG